MKRNYNEELNAAFNAVKRLDNKNYSEKELADVVDRFRIAASEYAENVVRYARGIDEKKAALCEQRKDDELAFYLGLSKMLFEGLDLPSKKAETHSLNSIDLYRATFERIRHIETAPAAYIYRAITNALSEKLREHTIDEFALSINSLIGDEKDGPELEELIGVAVSAEDVLMKREERRKTDLILARLLTKLAKENALAFVAFSTALEPNSRGEINGRSRNQDLSRVLTIEMEKALKVHQDQEKASEVVARVLWEEAKKRYESMHFYVDFIEMPILFSNAVTRLSALEEGKRALRFGQASHEAHKILLPYCTMLARMIGR